MGIGRNGVRMVAVAGLLAMAAVGRAAPAPLPTMDDISGMMDKGDWKGSLAAIARVMELKGTAAAPYDRGKLLMDRAESQLQLHDKSGAVATLNMAKKEAKDDASGVEPTALLELLLKAPTGTYTPKGAGKTPIAVTDREKRKDAYAALEADELTVLQAQVKNVSKSTSLPPIVKVAQTAAPVRALEIAATGKSTETEEVTKELSSLAQKLMTDALNDLSKQVEAISTSANRQITVTTGMNLGGGRGSMPVQQSQPVGLTGTDTQNLRKIETQCDQFPPAAKDLGEAFGDPQAFSAIGTQATTIKTRADAVLNASYTGNGLGAPYNPQIVVPRGR